MRLVNKSGGTLNGFTSLDYTAYFETLPADRVDLGLRIEADRMANSVFDLDEVESERTVIISEREGRENSPNYLLREELMALAFRSHPYGHQVIGWKEDLRQITRDDLWDHYRTYYGPHNAVLIVSGDIDVIAARARVEELFAPIQAGPPPPRSRCLLRRHWPSDICSVGGVRINVRGWRSPASRAISALLCTLRACPLTERRSFQHCLPTCCLARA